MRYAVGSEEAEGGDEREQMPQVPNLLLGRSSVPAPWPLAIERRFLTPEPWLLAPGP